MLRAYLRKRAELMKAMLRDGVDEGGLDVGGEGANRKLGETTESGNELV